MLCRRGGGRPEARRAKGRLLSAIDVVARRDVDCAGEPLSLAHRAEVEPLLTARWSPEHPAEHTLSDPWFANLYLFRRAHDWRLLRAPLPCIAGRGYDGARLLIPLFELQSAPRAVLQGLLRGHDAFGPLSGAQAARLDAQRFALHSSRDDADYLYPAEQFRHFRGAGLHRKRNLVKQLHAAHRVEAVPYREAMADEARQVLDAWMAAKGKQPGEADETACLEALALCGTLGLHGFLHRIEGRPVGFVLAQPIRPGVSVMRFAKAMDAFKGLYQHMFQHYCRAMPQLAWLNFEQDLGLANFRRTKLSYKPAALLAKIRVTLR
jgi:plasmid stability protein